MTLKFDKIGESHAIVEFTAVVKFGADVQPVLFGELAGQVNTLAESINLPAKLALPTFAISIGNGVSESPVSGMTTQIGYQRFSAKGEAEERLIASPNTITYSTRDYKGWAETLPILLNISSALAPFYLKSSPTIGRVQLQYQNEFTSLDSDFVQASDIFSKDTRWVSSNRTSATDLWHSHVGEFIPDGSCRQLVNVDVDCFLAREPSRSDEFTAVRANILAARTYDVDRSKPLIVDHTMLVEVLTQELDKTHTLEKKVLSDILSEDYLKLVGAK